MLLTQNRKRWLHLMIWAGCLAWAGCTTVQQQFQETRPTPFTPDFSTHEIRLHLTELNAPEVQGRGTALPGMSAAARYLSARLKAAGIQPVRAPQYAWNYPASVSYPEHASLSLQKPDSLLHFIPGRDFLADARSDTGTTHFSSIYLNPPDTLSLRNQVILLAQTDTSQLQQAHKQQAKAVLLVGPLEPVLSPAPLPGVQIIQITPALASLLTDLPEDTLQVFSGKRVLTGIATLHTQTFYSPHATALNFGGYFAGKHPEYSQELVVICAEIDGIGMYPGWGTIHPRFLGEGAAALLEIARNIGSYAPFLRLPERTIFFALWSGARQGHQGFSDFLKHPLWESKHIRHIIYIDPQPQDKARLQTWAKKAGFSLSFVETPYPVLPPLSPPLPLDPLLEPAIKRTLSLAQEAHYQLIHWYLTPYPFAPAREDTLPPPPDTR